MKLIKEFLKYDVETYTPPSNVKITSKVLTERTRKETKKGGVIVEHPLYEYRGVKYSMIGYEELVIKLIRDRYPMDEELALLRKKASGLDTKHEFEEYNTYTEQCKSQAKEFVTTRDNALAK